MYFHRKPNHLCSVPRILLRHGVAFRVLDGLLALPGIDLGLGFIFRELPSSHNLPTPFAMRCPPFISFISFLFYFILLICLRRPVLLPFRRHLVSHRNSPCCPGWCDFNPANVDVTFLPGFCNGTGGWVNGPTGDGGAIGGVVGWKNLSRGCPHCTFLGRVSFGFSPVAFPAHVQWNGWGCRCMCMCVYKCFDFDFCLLLFMPHFVRTRTTNHRHLVHIIIRGELCTFVARGNASTFLCGCARLSATHSIYPALCCMVCDRVTLRDRFVISAQLYTVPARVPGLGRLGQLPAIPDAGPRMVEHIVCI